MKVAMAKQMHEIDDTVTKQYGLPELSLMESAGHKVFETALKIFGSVDKKNFCVMAGSGNNGGDALVTARFLMNHGAKVKIFLFGDKNHRTKSFEVQNKIVRAMGIEILTLESDRSWERLQIALKFTDAIIDGILGTGFFGEIRQSALRLIRLLNSAGKKIISIDIPSGVASDTGAVDDVAINATCTVALGLPKPGHFICPGANYVGKLIVDDIGIPATLFNDDIHQTLIDDELAKTFLPIRARDVHKGSCGKILVIAGSIGMTGAASLASMAALKVGAGVVTLAVPESLNNLYEVKLTEVMTFPLPETKTGIIAGKNALSKLLEIVEEFDAILMGPGLGRDIGTLELVRNFVGTVDKPFILDADAIFAFNGKTYDLKQCKQFPIITPHLGELAALLGTPVDDLRKSLVMNVRKASQDFNSIIVAKSECTIIAYPNGEIFISALGNNGMATAGSGDVLAGSIAGLMKQTPFAPLAGVYLHGTAGDFAATAKSEGLIASDILENLPLAVKKIRSLTAEEV